MKVYVRIGTVIFIALLDSGSTHNFIDDAIVHHEKILVRAQGGLSVAVANGDRVQCLGKCPPLHASVFGEPFKLDCYVLPLRGYDLILGVRWLSALGPILWDFNNSTMSFHC